MHFISYAQNFEDVILWRALKNIEKGFYIDVGAAWPENDSVTKAFYDKGWRGINVEPNKQFYTELELARPNDINLCLALGESESNLIMNFIEGTGLSTLDSSIAQFHQSSDWKLNPQKVQVKTLDAIWREYLPLNQQVHFLKVDVEGFEADVLRGNDWVRNRPWIVLVESTKPLSRQESYQDWESLLISNNYLFAYADGLNRFYVDLKYSNLLDVLKYPPNVFDEFVKFSQIKALMNAQEAEVKAQEAEVKTQEAEVKAQEAEVKAQEAIDRLSLVISSNSWKLTKPIRKFVIIIKKIESEISYFFRLLYIKIVSICKSNFKRLVFFIYKNSTLHKYSKKILNHIPVFYHSLLSYSVKAGLYDKDKISKTEILDFQTEYETMSPRAMQIYLELTALIKNNKGGD